MGLKILCRVGTHILLTFFLEKNVCILKGHKIKLFPRKPDEILGSTSKFR